MDQESNILAKCLDCAKVFRGVKTLPNFSSQLSTLVQLLFEKSWKSSFRERIVIQLGTVQHWRNALASQIKRAGTRWQKLRTPDWQHWPQNPQDFAKHAFSGIPSGECGGRTISSSTNFVSGQAKREQSCDRSKHGCGQESGDEFSSSSIWPHGWTQWNISPERSFMFFMLWKSDGFSFSLVHLRTFWHL